MNNNVARIEWPVTPRLVDVVLVPVALVKTRPDIVPLDETRFVIVPFVTKRFVDVAFVVVALTTSIPFQRNVGKPNTNPLSLDWIRSEFNLAFTVKLSDESLPNIEFPFVAKLPVVVVCP